MIIFTRGGRGKERERGKNTETTGIPKVKEERLTRKELFALTREKEHGAPGWLCR